MAARRPAPPPPTRRTSCEEMSNIRVESRIYAHRENRFKSESDLDARAQSLTELRGVCRAKLLAQLAGPFEKAFRLVLFADATIFERQVQAGRSGTRIDL